MQSLFILGRQPALGLAELESLYGAESVKPVGTGAAIVDIDPSRIDFDRLGGSMKFGKLLTSLETTEWRDIEQHLVEKSPSHAVELPEGKLTIGISAYGLRVNVATINATGLSLKKAIRKTDSGRSVRLVPNKELELNTAQVLHNNLTGKNGWELLLVRNGDHTLLAQTVSIQDIESYTVRDRDRPKRDARVGMLPPKLAQIIINLAVGRLARSGEGGLDYIMDLKAEEAKPTGPSIPSDVTILDPFCGTGVILLESLLMRYRAYGTDIETRMVDYSQKNIDWLSRAYDTGDYAALVETADATKYHWPARFTHVASETYLGRPFTSTPSPEMLNQTISECNLILKKFLKNIAGQMPVGTRLCLAVPAWQVRKGQFKHLSFLRNDSSTDEVSSVDLLRDMGYNRISFEHARTEDLLYYREDQVVARELLVLEFIGK